jgi:ATP-dependent Lhr-like helicase
LVELFEAQIICSEVPLASGLLAEESPSPEGNSVIYTFHTPLHRAACEALSRASSTRLGRRIGQALAICVGDLGWSIHLANDVDFALTPELIRSLFAVEGFEDDVLDGLDRSSFLAQQFSHVAAIVLMVLRNREHGRRVHVGGLNWVSSRLYPLIKSVCPNHLLLRETRRHVLENVLDVPSATC